MLKWCSCFCFVWVKDHFCENSGDFFKDEGVNISSALDSSSSLMGLSSAEPDPEIGTCSWDGGKSVGLVFV